MPRNPERDALMRAINGSKEAAARLWGMKYRASRYQPTAAVGTFPFGPARTCAEWEELPTGEFADRQMTDIERRRDAKRGSRMLRDAIRRMAA
jgi:hypothetical protein